jgi:hypothetical protein
VLQSQEQNVTKCPSSNLGGTGWHLGICSYHEIYVLMTKARDEKLKFEKAHFYLSKKIELDGERNVWL